MRKGMLVLIVGLFLLGGVSAASNYSFNTNWASTTNGATTEDCSFTSALISEVQGCSNYNVCWMSIPEVVASLDVMHDDDTATSRFVTPGSIAGMQGTITIDLDSGVPIKNIERVEIWQLMFSFVCQRDDKKWSVVDLSMEFYSNGVWSAPVTIPIGSTSPIGQPSFLDGFWQDVEKVRYNFNSVDSYQDIVIMEIKTIGHACAADDCTDFPGQCGLLSDGCGGTIDCGGCVAPEICQSGTCVTPGACVDNDRIMKLSAGADSTGAFWNDGGSVWDICYSNIFGEVYSGDMGTVHNCDTSSIIPENKVVGLNAVAGANAERPDLDNYVNDVCYGDLSCTMREGGCLPGEKNVLNLYSDSNSHLTDSNYQPVGLVSEWRLEEDTGIVAADSFDGNDGTLNGYGSDSNKGVDGKIGKALRFDGVQDYVEVLDNSNLESSEMTMGMWVRPTDWGHTPSGHVSLISKRVDSSSGYFFFKLSSSNTLNVDFGSSAERWNTGYLPPLNSWTYLTYTYDGAVGTLYVNGVYESNTLLGNGASIPSASALRIGANSAADNYFFEGDMDEVSIYDRALTLGEVRGLYEIGAAEKKICCGHASVLEWRDMNGNVITDAEVGDTVRMVKTNAVSGGVFEVFEEDDGLIGFLLGGDDDIRTVDGVLVGSDVIGEWTITEEDMARTGDYDDFQFEIGGETSGDLNIGQNEDDDSMNVTIDAPNCGDDFDEGDTVEVSVSARDGDDLITGTVFIDGIVTPFSNGGVVFDHYFGIPGNHQVVVSATNDRGERSRSIASVMVLDRESGSYVDGDYVAACISEPADFSAISGSYVDFDASGTRGIKVSGGVPVDVAPGSVDLNFYWTFFPERREYGEQYNGTGNSLAYDFGTVFANAGDNSATLRVEIN
jgi:hypothetical protein